MVRAEFVRDEEQREGAGGEAEETEFGRMANKWVDPRHRCGPLVRVLGQGGVHQAATTPTQSPEAPLSGGPAVCPVLFLMRGEGS